MPGGDYGYGGGYGGPPARGGYGGPEGYGRRERYGGPPGDFNSYGPPGGRGGYDDPRGGYGGPGGYPGGGPGGYPGGGPGYGGMETAQSPLDAEIQVVIREIHQEISLFEQAGEYGEQYKNARRLLAAEADKLENSIDPEWLEVDIPKPIKVTKKILIPNFRHPHFNFVGKVLGPKGAHLQALAKQYKCHIYVLGRGSTKDRAKEQELLNSGDAQYAHYGGPLHVKVETIAPAHVAYSRIAGVLEHLSKTLVPIREGGDPNETESKGADGDKDAKQENGGGPSGRGGRGGSRGRGGPDRGRGGFRGGPRGGPRGGFRPY